eukprot:5202975-Pleurochrysis_carterae.AAC.4
MENGRMGEWRGCEVGTEYMRTHARTHTHLFCTHTRTSELARTRTRAGAHGHKPTRAQTRACTHALGRIHTRTHTTHAHNARTHAHAPLRTRAHFPDPFPRLTPLFTEQAMFMWRGGYLSKQLSWTNMILVPMFWMKSMVFGRDISRF